MSAVDPKYLIETRDYYDGFLVRSLAELSVEVDKAAPKLDRPGARAIRNRLVKAVHLVLDAHRMARHMQAELDAEFGIGRTPAVVIAFPTARVTELRVIGAEVRP